jgi:hypothetical protein
MGTNQEVKWVKNVLNHNKYISFSSTSISFSQQLIHDIMSLLLFKAEMAYRHIIVKENEIVKLLEK